MRFRIRDLVIPGPWIRNTRCKKSDPGSWIWDPNKHPGPQNTAQNLWLLDGCLLTQPSWKHTPLLSGRRASVQQPWTVLLAAWRGHARPPASGGQPILVSGHEHCGLPLHRRQILPHRHELPSPPLLQCLDPWHFGTDPDPWIRASDQWIRIPDPAIFVLDLQDANKKLIFVEVFCLLLFEVIFT